MSAALFIERIGRALTLACLFLLPWQTRYIFWSPFVGTTESEFGVISIYATMLLAGSAAACWWVSGVARGMERRQQTADDRQQMMSSGLQATGDRRQMGSLRYLISFICFPLSLIFFLATPSSPAHAWILNVWFAFLLGYATYKTVHQNGREAICALLLGFIPAFALGLWQMFAGWSPASSWFGLASRAAERLGDAVLMMDGQRVLRMYGSFPHPNIFGAALALVCSVIATMSFRHRPQAQREGGGEIFENQGRESRRSLPLQSLRRRVVEMTWRSRLLIAIFVLIAAILFFISRSAALAMACALLASYGVSHKKKALLVFACILPVFVWSLQFISPGLLALRGQSAPEQQSISERVVQVGEWWQVMQQHGLWGTGIYEYPQAIANIQGASLPAWAYQPAHNVFLLVIAELGIVGCGVLGVGGWMMIGRMKTDVTDKKQLLSSIKNTTHFQLLTQNFTLPFLVTLFSLSWFDHALWTSWSGMAYIAVAIALVFQGQESRISTLSQGVLDEKK